MHFRPTGVGICLTRHVGAGVYQAMHIEGPFERYTLIYCRADEVALSRRAAFSGDGEALEHARIRLLHQPPEWISVVIARGIDAHGAALDFLGSWERDQEGAVTWDAASLA